MSFVLALSFSNIQHSFGLPTIFAGLAFYAGSEGQLVRLPNKERLASSQDFRVIKTQIERFERFVIAHEVIALSKKEWCIDKLNPPEIIDRYLDCYSHLIELMCRSNHNVLVSKLEKCLLHIPLDCGGKNLSLQQKLSTRNLIFDHPIFQNPIVFVRKNSPNKFMQLTRLYVRYYYLEKRNSKLSRRGSLGQRGRIYTLTEQGNKRIEAIQNHGEQVQKLLTDILTGC